ncbi:TraB/GumN family protein [Flavihumibacter sp. UBA7668]|uniref:TraB/GumN family protein n=1 Tax=Flavihumibacter sp. UBA7668 TaxID=1946542 RepID=UPI0025BFAFD2|nr:TraB/GumN family protein [Flavihumibacter sp. UBA7668]
MQNQHSEATLLWRISSPDKKAPSYLYGTMHLQDKRLFHFTDSLYASIKSVDGFAGELDMNDMNELVASWVRKGGDINAPVSLLKDYITTAQKKKYKSALEKKFAKRLDAITLKELDAEADNWTEGFRKEDDMPTFVDAFLYGIAKREGKWIGALEVIEDQLDAKPTELEDRIKAALLSDKEKQKIMDQYVAIYLSGNLDRMYEIVTNAGGNYGAWKMNHRNFNMVKKMDSLIALRSCFYAVGAAHLSGDSGIIQLLRNKGYKVDPVESDNRIAPDKYLVQLPSAKWQEVHWGDGDFSIKMPGAASSLDGMGGFHQARMYFDPLSMSGFMSGYIPLINKSEAEIDSVCQLMPSFYATEGKLYRDSSWLLNGKKAYEIEASTKDGFVNMVVHPVPGGIVMNMIISMSQAGIKMHQAATFFNSFVNNKKPLPPPVKGWRRKIYALKQFSFESPVELTYSSKNTDSSWNNETYSGTDPETKIFYSFTAMETRKGYYSRLDCLYFQELINQYDDNTTHKLLNHSFFTLDGFPGVSMLLGTKVEKDSVHVTFNVINRGNRRYSILVGYFPTDQQRLEVDRFINGIRFLPYTASKTLEGHPAYENFSIQSPGRFYPENSDDLTEGSTRFVLYDSTSAVTVHVQKDPLNKYYRSSGDSSFFREQLTYFIGESDSILQYELNQLNGRISADANIDLEGTHNVRRVKLLASGDTLYSVSCVMSPEVANSIAYRKMFDSFQIETPSANNYTRSKAKLVLNDLLLPDSLAFQEAKAALEWVYIDSSDLPQLHEALLHPMIDFSERSNCTHDELIKRILELNDPSTVAFIRKAYPGLKERITELQYPLLSVLARMYTSETYSILEQLMESGLPTAGNAGILYGSMKDSLELARRLFPLILKNKDDSLISRILPGIVYDMKMENLISGDELKTVQSSLYALADEYIIEQRSLNIQLPLYFDALLDLLIAYDDAGSRQRLDSFVLHSNEDVKYAAFKALTQQKKAAPLKTIQELAADPFYRLRVWEELSDAGLEKTFPPALRNQLSIAESHLFREVWNESGEADLQFLKEITKKIDGKKHRLFLYKVSFKTEDGQEEYLGVAGPYPIKGKMHATPGEFNGVYYDEMFDAYKINDLLEAFIQSLQ